MEGSNSMSRTLDGAHHEIQWACNNCSTEINPGVDIPGVIEPDGTWVVYCHSCMDMIPMLDDVKFSISSVTRNVVR